MAAGVSLGNLTSARDVAASKKGWIVVFYSCRAVAMAILAPHLSTSYHLLLQRPAYNPTNTWKDKQACKAWPSL